MKEFKLRVESPNAFSSRLIDAGRRIDAGDYAVAEFGYSFHSAEALFALLTPNRWRLLSALRQHGAWSIRALGKALGRDYKAVHTDVTALIEAGLIERDEKSLISVPWTKISAELLDSEAEAA